MVFTQDTYIAPTNTTYDGQDLVVLDCTVTVDGSHTFASVVLASDAVLTHSFSTNGQIAVAMSVTNAPYVLPGSATGVELANTNISSPLLVTDTNGNVYTEGVDYLEFTYPYGTWIEQTTNSSIPDGGTVLVSYSYYGSVSAGLDLMVTGVVWVASDSEITANDIGYGSGFGPGAGSSSGNMFFFGSGGGYGGSGGMSLSNAVGGVCYDSLYQPSIAGSGGGSSYAGTGGNGGGLVQITASGEVEIDGAISANGENATNSRSGGGSGGGIYISAPSVSGAGSITANGGLGAPDYGGGGGGGGRIAIVCGMNNFSGTMTAYGGGGAYNGGAGTVFTELTGAPGLLALNNNGNPGANSTVTLSNVADVAISNGAVVAVSGPFLPQNATIGTNGVLTGQSQTSLQFSVSNLTVTAGGTMSVNGLGYLTGGAGAGGSYSSGGVTYGGGGGHGGYGGPAAVTNAVGGNAYDAQPNPSGLGSSGGGGIIIGGAGGGAINVNVTGTLLVNGSISANGWNGSGLAGGGGSGGSVYLTAATMSGNGTITANGGGGANLLGGGGGGGRIAIVANTYNFIGTANCYGGGGGNYGGAGTLFSSQTGLSQTLVLDNGGNTGPSTMLQTAGGANLFVQNGAWGTLPAGSAFASLLVGSNAWVTAPANSTATTVTIASYATFQAGGGLTLNSDGSSSFESGHGGTGTILPYPGGGGGNGGVGGAGAPSTIQYEPITAPGGPAGFNLVTSPNEPGGNGGGETPYSIGGMGGGTVNLIVSGILQVNGTIMANGGNGSGEGGGGGAGGSLNLFAGTFAGSGSITANGGNGVDSTGGGGGGGCIAILFNTNQFNGSLAAFGGVGANDGGAGTIYFRTNSAVNGQIIVDNGGLNGAAAVLTSFKGNADLTLRNNSILAYTTPSTLTFGNILITNASLVASNYPIIIDANNLTVQNGGRITVDRGGYGPGTGPDAGKIGQAYLYAGSGGGNGGCGGSAVSNSVAGGGGGFEPYFEPTEAGSSGGGETPYSIGGTGGGVIELNITGKLALNGTLSANGGNGGGSGGGGGAGGSLQLEIGSLTGSGSISANGGSGVDGTGGGGGGGMIGIIFEQGNFSNSFTGAITAYGGGGWTNGGAGTIFIKTNNTGQATLIVDNGGNIGTNTPISISSSSYSVIIRNGAIAALPDGPENFSSLLITSNSWLVPNVPQQGTLGEVYLTLSGSATIQAGGGINANSDGSAQEAGTGHGSSETVSPTYPCSGGGHGGDGGFSISNLVAGGGTYDSIATPTGYGSGGGSSESFSVGGSGGGLVYLDLIDGGTLLVNGTISANGGNGSGVGGGGGSGGTVSLMANVISGTGSITANGGVGALNGGGGGGGCIALNSSEKVVTNVFLGTISAYGGGGANYGGAGTLYYRTNSNLQIVTPELYLDNGGNVGTDTTVTISGVNLVIQNGAIGAIPASPFVQTTVMVLSNSELTSLAVGQTIVQATSLNIFSGGVFSVDGGGYPAQNGQGAGSAAGGISGGGGHGGYGGGNVAGGGAYDVIQTPFLEGSGGANSSTGAGGIGGGALNITVTQGLVVNGRISANGRTGGLNAGGGAGGSINIAQALSMSGTGVIAANGGAGSDSGGGGAGGRIAVATGLNTFTGQYSASGGGGSSPGGAGTIFTKTGSGQTLQINNGGIIGTNTPIFIGSGLPSTPFELDISHGASVVPFTPLPLLSNLNVLASSTLTMPIAQSNFVIAVMGNSTIAGDLDVDYLGNPLDNGPGAGVAIDAEGSGGGYGGAGGASDSGAPGGNTYGSAAHPTDFGSGGGNGADTTGGGSEGGGALRLSVGGTLNVTGNISANGDTGLQDDSGGGSGGSVWITAGTLSGSGTISAAGGDGVLYGGGGGGGGRIAIYTITNQFTGTTNASGGLGVFSGQSGTVSLASALSGLQILSQSPTGSVLNTVSSVNLTFSDMLNAGSVSASDFAVVTPAGALSQTSLIVTVASPYSVQLSFPTQNLVGTYTVQVAGGISDTFGASLAQPYSGTFTVSLPTISGTVTGTNGAGVPGVSMQPGSGLIAATTDSNGNYSLGVPPGWTGTVTPSLGSNMFLPASMSYTNVTGSLTNQNYSMVSTLSPALTTSLSGGNCSLNWNGVSGVTYQVLWSTNLVTWQPFGSPIAGTNGLIQMMLPRGTNCAGFFQLQVAQ